MSTDDLQLSLSPVKKSAPARGRRAAMAQDFQEEADDTLIATANPLQSRDNELFQDSVKNRPPGHGRRTGGWADENSRAKTAKSVRMDYGGIGSDDDDNVGPIIPDLDDVRDEDMAFQVAEAPSVAVNRVATYKELDNDLLKHVAFATLDDIDLKLLTKRMAPEAALKEADEAWNWDVLFAEVSGDLQKEWYPEELTPEAAGGGSVGGAEQGRERPYTAFNRFPV